MKRATIFQVDGTRREVTPADGVYFSLEEMQKIVGGYIQILPLNEEMMLVVNEDGKIMDPPLPVNPSATLFTRNLIANDDLIVGDVLICSANYLQR